MDTAAISPRQWKPDQGAAAWPARPLPAQRSAHSQGNTQSTIRASLNQQTDL